MAIYMPLVNKKFTIAAVLVAGVVFIGLDNPAGAQDADERLYVVTHVDVLGQNGAAEAAQMLHQFAADSRKDQGSVRFEVLRDPVRLNHFTIVEVWRTRQDFESHLAASHTKAFREKLQPMLGSPFDERLHKLLP
jgi:quinol monooxygenase YgiN